MPFIHSCMSLILGSDYFLFFYFFANGKGHIGTIKILGPFEKDVLRYEYLLQILKELWDERICADNLVYFGLKATIGFSSHANLAFKVFPPSLSKPISCSPLRKCNPSSLCPAQLRGQRPPFLRSPCWAPSIS